MISRPCNLLLDTNILLDFIVENRPGHHDACRLLERIDQGIDNGMVSAGSLKDFYYICCKYLSEPHARAAVSAYMDILELVALDRPVCERALVSDEPDFEDGIVRAMAEMRKVDFIISRDAGAFEQSSVKSLDAQRYLALMDEANK